MKGSVMATRNPRLGKPHCILVTTAPLISERKRLPLCSTYIPTLSLVQPYYHTVRLRSRIGICAFTLYSSFQWSNTFCSRGYTICTPSRQAQHNWQKTNSLRINPTVHHLLCLRLHLASICSSIENLRSPLCGVTPILTWWASVRLQDEILDKSDQVKDDNTTDIEDDLGDHQGNILCDMVGDNPCEPEPTMQSKIASMW